ncbi:MAG: hypothetical protein ACLQIQ_04115 [Beijerinckiaceae bacterium]
MAFSGIDLIVALPQTNPATAAETRRAFANEFDSRLLERADQLRQGLDVSPNDAITRFHALDCRQRKFGDFGQFSLVKTEQGTGSPKLRGRYHV